MFPLLSGDPIVVHGIENHFGGAYCLDDVLQDNFNMQQKIKILEEELKQQAIRIQLVVQENFRFESKFDSWATNIAARHKEQVQSLHEQVQSLHRQNNYVLARHKNLGQEVGGCLYTISQTSKHYISRKVYLRLERAFCGYYQNA